MWLKPQGHSEIISPVDDIVSLDHIRREAIPPGVARWDTATCFHCNSVFHVSARMKPEDIGGLCPHCWHIICPKCVDKGCTPFEKKLEEADKRAEALRSYGL